MTTRGGLIFHGGTMDSTLRALRRPHGPAEVGGNPAGRRSRFADELCR